MDGSTTKRLRAGLAAAIVLGLGGVIAPGHAKDIAPLPEAPSAMTDSSDAATPPATDDSTDDADSWQTVGSGIASWYGPKFKGHLTASGERFDPTEYTAAHRTLPFGTRVRVTDAAGNSVIVRINDRGPYAHGRVIDLSRAAAKKLGLTRRGSGKVTLAVLDDGSDSDQ